MGPENWVERDISLEEEESRPPTRRRILNSLRRAVQLKGEEKENEQEKGIEHEEENGQDTKQNEKMGPRRSSRLHGKKAGNVNKQARC
jgi:hypothetical protein